jgi:hypothetical protein
MDPKATVEIDTKQLNYPEADTPHKPLELLRDTEALLRRPTVATLVPILSPRLGNKLQRASSLAEDSLKDLAEIDLKNISDFELRSPRIRIGLSFVGFSALMTVVLLLYLYTLHPELSTVQQVGLYWHEYIWFVCLGVAGMFILGREAMRPIQRQRR